MLAEAGGIITLDLGARPFTGVILCITCHFFPGNVCPEVVRQQPEEIPGGGEEVEETATARLLKITLVHLVRHRCSTGSS